jgi:hypothetical protein
METEYIDTLNILIHRHTHKTQLNNRVRAHLQSKKTKII